MINRIIYLLCALSLLASVTSSCTDELLYDDAVIGDGEAMVTVDMDFHPLAATVNNPASRASGEAGDAIANINSITVFLYNEEGLLRDIITQDEMTDLKLTKHNEPGANTSMPNDAGGKPVQAEESTARATFTLPKFNFGKYYIYAVANVPGLDDTEENREKFNRVNDLRNYEVQWNNDDVPSNDQMFGYVTYSGNDNETSAGYDAPLLTINQKMVKLHSWIKRAASKVTVVYDGSGLHEGVYIYVKNVTIRDIPVYCKLGADNKLTSNKPDSMIAVGGMIEYDTKGVLPDGSKQGPNSTDWLEISKGGGKKGAVMVVNKDTITHSETERALYFYENMQGNYADAVNKEYYDKRQIWANVGYMPKPGEYDYKDNIKYGTYIEVEAYYLSENQENVSSGVIKYRYMLGQNDTYDYNATRNHHYKLTLGFKGWANQPDWHIDYIEPENTVYVDPTYYVSYSYNTKAIFPIRFIGTPKSVEVEIVENNWAPYDSKSSDSVPPGVINGSSQEYSFKWNKAVYENSGKRDVTNVNNWTDVEINGVYKDGFYYGLQKPLDKDGEKQISYDSPLAPKYVTPIFVGFLALHVPSTNLHAVLFPNQSYKDNTYMLKNYFYGKGGGDGFSNNLPQNYRSFPAEDFEFPDWTAGQVASHSAKSGTGNNECTISKGADGSITLDLPMWTRAKSLFGISGFTGNNPYDTYQRKAMVKVTVDFGGSKPVVKYLPVFQVRRVVNPKAVWRSYNDNTSFKVILYRREGAASTHFNTFDSNGAWRATIKTVSPGADGFISLSGGASQEGPNRVYGGTGTPVEFNIDFNGKGVVDQALCAIVEVEYHGFTCKHSIFVRQGYKTPLSLGGSQSKWSSFGLYRCPNPPAFGTTWKGDNYIQAELTVNPLSFGSFFKRGNYNAIMLSNNETYGVAQEVPQKATFLMGDGSYKTWENIEGYPFSKSYGGWSWKSYGDNAIQTTYTWGRFVADIDFGTWKERRYFRLPTLADYTYLRDHCEYGIGVMYGDGSIQPEDEVDEAYGFEDFLNDGFDETAVGEKGSTRGMRGFIVFDPATAHQIFFPLGARGVGRRTIAGYSATAFNHFGELRYSNVLSVLDGNANSKRPIPYDMPAAPGAMYWMEQCYSGGGAWDANYFDLNFTTYSFPIGFTPNYGKDGHFSEFNMTHGGDALPIRLIYTGSGGKIPK